MHVHRACGFGPLIGERHVRLGGRAVLKGDGHGVRIHSGIAFRHQLGLRADRVVAFRDGDGIAGEFHAVRHVMHVHRARGLALFIGEGHFRQAGLAVGERNAHRLHRDGLIVRRHQFFLGRDKIVAFGDGNGIRGKFLPVGYIMNLDFRPGFRLLIAEGNDGWLGLAVHERHLHRVGLEGLVAFGHKLIFRRDRGFLRGHGHINAAELIADLVHIGHVHLPHAAQLHKVAHDVADLLFVIFAEIADVVPELAVYVYLTMHGDRRFLVQRADNINGILAAFRRSTEIDRSFFRDRIAGHVVQGRVAAVGFGAGFCGLLRGRFRLWVSSVAGIAGVTCVPCITCAARIASISSIAGIPGVSGVATITSIASIAAVPAGGADRLHDKKNVSRYGAVIVHCDRLGRGIDHLIAGDLALTIRRELIYAGSHVIAGIIQQRLPVLRNVINVDGSVHRRGLRNLLGGQIHIAGAGVVGLFLVAVELHQRDGLRHVRRRCVLLGHRGGLVGIPPEIAHIIIVGTSVRHPHGDLQGPRGAVRGLGPIIGDPVLPRRHLPHGGAGLAVGVRVGHIDHRHIRRFRGQRPQRGRQLQKNHQQTGQKGQSLSSV